MNDIASRWAQREAQARETTAPVEPTHRADAGPSSLEVRTLARGKYRHYKPFVDAVKVYVSEARDGERIYFGIPEFDQQIRGVGRSQLCVINGYSHSGKTLLLAHILRHNKHKRVALFSPDEPAQLVLAKLASAESGVPADEIEDRIASGDEEAVNILRDTALRSFPNLIVFDKPCTGQSMVEALAEAEMVWGDKAECVVFDYLELLQAGETVPAKFEFIKAFGTEQNLPIILIHQTSRSGGKDGAAQTISSGTFGGETFATFQLGVWRKKAAIAAMLVDVRDKIARAANGATPQMQEQLEDLTHELARAEFTLTIAITKNKRPGRREGREEIDFELFGATGLISPLAEGDLPSQYRNRLASQRTQLVREQHPIAADYGEQQTMTDDEFYEEQW